MQPCYLICLRNTSPHFSNILLIEILLMFSYLLSKNLIFKKPNEKELPYKIM